MDSRAFFLGQRTNFWCIIVCKNLFAFYKKDVSSKVNVY